MARLPAPPDTAGWAKYDTLASLKDYYFEDSWVHKMFAGKSLSSPELDQHELFFDMTLVLTREHPRFYWPPKENEQHAYMHGRLVFPNLRRMQWLELRIYPTWDPDGSIDLGNIHLLRYRDSEYYIYGDFGVLIVEADTPYVSY